MVGRVKFSRLVKQLSLLSFKARLEINSNGTID